MSQAYDMQITVRDFDLKRLTKLYNAIRELWHITEDSHGTDTKGRLFAEYSGVSSLLSGEDEEGFARKVRLAAWKAAGRCEVEVVATCLEELPNCAYLYDTHDYDVDAVRLGIKEYEVTNRAFIVTLDMPPKMTVGEVQAYISDAICAWKDQLHKEARVRYLDEASVRVTQATQEESS